MRTAIAKAGMTGLSLAVIFLSLLLLETLPAIAQIAPGVTQSAAHTANITGTVTQSDGMPVSGATVKLSGAALLSTNSDDHGVFNFRSVPWGTYQVVVTSALGTASRDNLVLNGDLTIAIQYQAAQPGLHTIAHVSATSSGAHINVTSSSVMSVSPSQYAFQGNATWLQLFAQIPGVAPSGYANGGYASYGVIPGAPQTPVVLTLNGALPYETSTTLDGMPLQGTSGSTNYYYVGGGIDLSNVPVNAFDAADVVRGPGANAPSIVDSVGGSFVLHAPGQVEANQFEFSASNDQYGGIVSNARVALRLGRLSATFIYGVNDSPGPLGQTSVMGFALLPSTIDGQAVSGPYPSEQSNYNGFTRCYCADTVSLLYCCAPLSTAWTAHNGAAALAYEITPSIVAGVFYSGTTSIQNSFGGYAPVEFSPAATVPPYSGSPATSPTGTFNYSFLHFGPPTLSASAGSLLEEKVTAYVGNGVLRLAALQNNTYNFSGGYLSFPNGQYRVFGTADVGAYPGAPTAFNGTSENLTFSNESYTYGGRSNNRDLLGSYAVQLGSASSIGVSYVTSYYNNPNFENFYIGKTMIPCYDYLSSQAETTNETRLHFDTQLSDKLSLGLSWYFANGTYHIQGATDPNSWSDKTFPYNAPRFGAVWEASPDIAVRVAAGGGYALPIMYDLTGSGLSYYDGTYSQRLPNPNIRPEETFGWDLGTDVRFHKDTVLSFDLYRTNLYGQFYSYTNESLYRGFPLYTSQFGNLGTSLMEGINLNLRHDVASGYYWSATLGLTRGFVVNVPPGFYNGLEYPPPTYAPTPCTNCTNQEIIPGANFNNAAGYLATIPYASASAVLGYRWSPGKYFDLSPTYYGNNNIYFEKAFVELDAHAGYAFTKNVSLSATFRNITGVYDQSIQQTLPTYQVPVIPGSQPYGVSLGLPYGPRTVIVTALFHY